MTSEPVIYSISYTIDSAPAIAESMAMIAIRERVMQQIRESMELEFRPLICPPKPLQFVPSWGGRGVINPRCMS